MAIENMTLLVIENMTLSERAAEGAESWRWCHATNHQLQGELHEA